MLADPALTIELVAAEPEVASPVAIAWDEDGRLYVAEMLDYPDAKTSGRIRMLEDRDGDGRYEHATVFVDGLPFPNGVLPCFGGVLVTAAPNIWFFRDVDGDGRADERRVLLTGFGEGNTQLRVNGLSWGLDNWIYVANGRSDGDLREPTDPLARAVSIRRRDVRFRLSPRTGPGDLRPQGRRGGVPRLVGLEAIAGFSQFGLASLRLGRPFSVVEHHPDSSCRARAARPGSQPLPGRNLVGGRDPRPGRRRPYLRDQPAAGPVQSRVGRLLQRQLRTADRARGPLARGVSRQCVRLRAAE